MTWRFMKWTLLCCVLATTLAMLGCGGAAPANCGDGTVDQPADMASIWCDDADGPDCEGCDDGNTDDGDGCSSMCATETGWICTTIGAGPTECTEL